MNKKLLSLVLTLVMVLGAFTSVFAAETKTTEKVEKITGKDNKIQYVVDKKLVEGYEDGSLGLDKNITRAEITKLLAIANGNKDLAAKLQGAMKLYSDVDNSHWANGVITVGTTVPSATNGQPMLQGYPDGSFKPENNVTYAELAKMLVVLVKTDLTADMVKEANAKWAGLWLTWAQQLGILDDVTVADSNAAANRGDAFTMVYNALYKMKNFRRTAANDKLGVLSSLNRDKLVLNQDAKEQEYTITTETVFVNAVNNKDGNANLIRVKNISDPNYYLGSLVRIITNDKKEVTHILELGNPSDLALGVAGLEGSNSRWNGVADRTVETKLEKDQTTLKSVYHGNHYANLQVSASDHTKVDSIYFKDANVRLAINSDTKVFVANPANNIMRQVKDINEAISLLGYKDIQQKIPNVYAGYDTYGAKSKYAPISVNNEGKTAKVIVFNVVAKEDKGTLLRVTNEPNTLGNATLENTKGEAQELSFLKSVNYFPYNYNADKWDVISIRYASNTAADVVNTEIDHSKTDKYPIVKVVDLDKDNKWVRVTDGKYTANLNIADADIFTAKDRLGKDAIVQFKVEEKTNNVKILSILPERTEMKGSLVGVVSGIFEGQRVGKLLKVNDNGANQFATIEVQVDNDIWNENAKYGYAVYNVNRADVEMLKEYVGKDIAFMLNKINGWSGDVLATNFKDMNGKDLPKVPSTNELIQPILTKYYNDGTSKALEEAKTKLEELAKEGKVTYKEAQDAIKEIEAYNETKVLPTVALKKSLDEQVNAKLDSKEKIAKFEEDLTAYRNKVNDLRDSSDKTAHLELVKQYEKALSDAKEALK